MQTNTIKHPLRVPLVITIIVMGVMMTGIYLWQYYRTTKLNLSISATHNNISNLNVRLAKITNQNDGIVSVPSEQPGIVSLLHGQVTFTMPTGWVIATASHYYQQCNNGSYDSKAMCLDSTTIVPKSFNIDNPPSTYSGITISVYKNDGASSAQDLFAQEGGMAVFDPHMQIQFLTINNISAWYGNGSKVPLEYGDQFNNEGYVLVNKSYVVRISSNVNNNAGPNGTMAFNDNSQYSPAVKSFVNTIKMQGN
ncbi:MAG TPA: hypothetical protein VFT53_03130 [Candidatus Saccharimonadales bacterium]|nr:hypothetical protein [Candidatus Saccharimonadales bacterium]